MANQVDPALTPEEQAQVMDIQDRLIDLFVDRGAAVSGGDPALADQLQGEIDDLLRQRDAIKMWATSDGE
jgi:hypothetical protein